MELKPIALIIEDNEDLNAIFSSALDKAGYDVRSVFNGHEATQFLVDTVPAIVVLDLHMPGISGDVVLKHIRTTDRLKNIRVIVATADAAFADALRYRPDLVLLKPISFSQLSQLAVRLSPKPDSADGNKPPET